MKTEALSTDGERPSGGGPLTVIQVMRGIAALAVVAFHTHIILLQPEYGGRDVFGAGAIKGWIGVNFFFVLSGFIIYFAHAKDVGLPSSIPRYLWRRFSRVYPIYWILLTAFIAAAAMGIGYPDFSWEPGHLFTAYTLLHVVDQPAIPLKVAWTLLFEVKFYLLFVVFLISRRAGAALFAFWAAAIIVRNCFTPLPDWGVLFPEWGLTSIWNINFLLGMGAAWIFLNRRPPATILLIGGLVLLGVALIFVGDMAATVAQPMVMAWAGVAFAAVILGAALTERARSLVMPAWAMLIGDASYAIYLVHSAAISQLANINQKLAPSLLPDWLLFVVIFLGATLAGITVHILLERRLLILLRKKPGIKNDGSRVADLTKAQ